MRAYCWAGVFNGLHDGHMLVVAPDLETASETYMLTLEMTPEIHDSLSQLARDTNQSLNDVIRSALGMYKLAVDARKSGKTVGISERPEHVQMKFF